MIDCYRYLPLDWDGDGAEPVSDATWEAARHLLFCLANEASRQGFTWASPDIGPTPDGGIDLTWDTGERYVSLTIEDGVTGIGCVKRERPAAAEYHVKSHRDAIEAALWAMSGR